MTENLIKFPVNCRICQKEWTAVLPQSEILGDLDRGAAIRVYSTCHDQGFDLNESERADLSVIARTAV